MFYIGDEDLGRAVLDLMACHFRAIGKLKWEIELKNRSEKFWKFIFVQMKERSLQAIHMRVMLTDIFATIYYACGETLPCLRYEKARKLFDSSMYTDEISKEVFHRMEELNADWSSTFHKINEEFCLNDYLRRIMFVAIKVLLDSSLRRRPDGDGHKEDEEEKELQPALAFI